MKKAVLAIATLLTLSLLSFGRGAVKPPITGKWHFVLTTPGGDREVDTSLQEADGKITGKWGYSDATAGSDVKGTLTDGHFALEAQLESTEVGPGTMKITGQPADDGTLTGDWAFGDYNGPFKATAINPAPTK